MLLRAIPQDRDDLLGVRLRRSGELAILPLGPLPTRRARLPRGPRAGLARAPNASAAGATGSLPPGVDGSVLEAWTQPRGGASLPLPGALVCFKWASSHIYNHETGKYEQPRGIHAACAQDDPYGLKDIQLMRRLAPETELKDFGTAAAELMRTAFGDSPPPIAP